MVTNLISIIKPFYDEPHRFYHNMDHINFMLYHGKHILDRAQYLAVLFHDIVYIAGDKDNEINSIILMKYLTSGIESNEDINIACRIIADTVDHKPSIPESSLVIDLDMLAMGLDYELFKSNNDNIRKEYPFITDTQYIEGRNKFLSSLLEDKIFHSDTFMMYEDTARNNIKRAIEELK